MRVDYFELPNIWTGLGPKKCQLLRFACCWGLDLQVSTFRTPRELLPIFNSVKGIQMTNRYEVPQIPLRQKKELQ